MESDRTSSFSNNISTGSVDIEALQQYNIRAQLQDVYLDTNTSPLNSSSPELTSPPFTTMDTKSHTFPTASSGNHLQSHQFQHFEQSDSSPLSSIEELEKANSMLERMEEDIRFAQQFIHLSSPDSGMDDILFPDIDINNYGAVEGAYDNHNNTNHLGSDDASYSSSSSSGNSSNENSKHNSMVLTTAGSISYMSMSTPSENSNSSTISSPHSNSNPIHIHHSNNVNNNNSSHTTHGSHSPTNELEVTLYHKPRGCKGIWKQVERTNALRVTKGKGKWLKLGIKTPHPFHSRDVDVFLIDISGHPNQQDIVNSRLVHTEDEGIAIETVSDVEVNSADGFYVSEVEIKLDRVCKRLQFWVTLKLSGRILVGRSVEFSAHNNGKTKPEHSNEASNGHHQNTNSPSSSDEGSPNHSFSIPTVPTMTSTTTSTQSNVTIKMDYHHPEMMGSPSTMPKSTQIADNSSQRSKYQPNSNLDPKSTMSHQQNLNNSYLMSSSNATPLNVINSVSPANQSFASLQAQQLLEQQIQLRYLQQQSFNANNAPISVNSTTMSNRTTSTISSTRSPASNPTPATPEPAPLMVRNPFNNPSDYLATSPANTSTEMSTIDPKKRKRTASSNPLNNLTIYKDENSVESNGLDVNVIPGNLRVNGIVKAQAFVQFSDLRLKTNIQELTDAVNIITKLEGRSYTWRKDLDTESGHVEEELGGRRVIGLIAQQVRKVLPEVVHEDKETGLLSVSYAEIVPVLIEAFKQQTQIQESQQEIVQEQLRELRTKLEAINAQFEEHQQRNPMGYYYSNYDQPPPPYFHSYGKSSFESETSTTSSQTLTFFPKSKVMRSVEKKLPPVVFHQNTCRISTVILFLLGLFLLLFGSIKLGILLYLPARTVTTEVLEARGLNSTVVGDSVPDPYVQVSIGYEVFRTETVWNSFNPTFDDTFSSALDPAFNQVIFQVYDDERDPSVAPRRIGMVSYSVDNLESGRLYDEWMDLQANSPEEPATGQLRVTVEINVKKKADYEIALIVIGVILLLISLVIGSTLWNRSKERVHHRRRHLRHSPPPGCTYIAYPSPHPPPLGSQPHVFVSVAGTPAPFATTPHNRGNPDLRNPV